MEPVLCVHAAVFAVCKPRRCGQQGQRTIRQHRWEGESGAARGGGMPSSVGEVVIGGASRHAMFFYAHSAASGWRR